LTPGLNGSSKSTTKCHKRLSLPASAELDRSFARRANAAKLGTAASKRMRLGRDCIMFETSSIFIPLYPVAAQKFRRISIRVSNRPQVRAGSPKNLRNRARSARNIRPSCRSIMD